MPTTTLRILHTSDLHMRLLPQSHGGQDRSSCLITMIPLIESLRGTTDATCLFDTGDFLQGSPLDTHFTNSKAKAFAHPMIEAFNALHYDAITLGNHEFDFGVTPLSVALEPLNCPIVLSNLNNAADVLPHISSHKHLQKTLHCSDGQTRPIKLGLIGLLTPSTIFAHEQTDSTRLSCTDILQAAKRESETLKAQGADLIIAMCHFGFDENVDDTAITHHDDNSTCSHQNLISHLIALNDIDVALLGHEHKVYPPESSKSAQPSTQSESSPKINNPHNKPVLMPGAYGSHLGVIDLELALIAERWSVTEHHTRTLPTTQHDLNDVSSGTQSLTKRITQRAKQQFAQATVNSSRILTYNTSPRNNFFARISSDCVCSVTAAAKCHIAQSYIQSQRPELAALPIICSVSSYQAGGHAGPDHYIDFPVGPITAEHIQSLSPYANKLSLSLRTGAELKALINHSCLQFKTITPGLKQQTLFSPQIAPYHNDTFFGLSYDVDLSQHETQNRIVNLQCQGRAISNHDQFILVHNSHRAAGGGHYPKIPPKDIIYTSQDTLNSLLISHFEKHPFESYAPCLNWRFKPFPDTSIVFETSPKARPMAHLVPERHIDYHKMQDNGFAQFEMFLD